MILKLIKEKLEIEKFRPTYKKLRKELEETDLNGFNFLIILMEELKMQPYYVAVYYSKNFWDRVTFQGKRDIKKYLEDSYNENTELSLAIITLLEYVEWNQ